MSIDRGGVKRAAPYVCGDLGQDTSSCLYYKCGRQ
jgi:hypothetical protein